MSARTYSKDALIEVMHWLRDPNRGRVYSGDLLQAADFIEENLDNEGVLDSQTQYFTEK